MEQLRLERSAFLDASARRRSEAGQLAAFQLACHVDLEAALGTDADTRARTVLRLERMIERERLRGSRSHWNYDLNRHIALKQALDRLRSKDNDKSGRDRSRNDAISHGLKRKRRPKAPPYVTGGNRADRERPGNP